MFTYKTKLAVYERSQTRCDCGCGREGYPGHHCFFASQYKKDDKDGAWNCGSIADEDHGDIHNPSPKRIRAGMVLDLKFKRQAYARYTGPHKEELSQILRRAEYKLKDYDQRNEDRNRH